MNALFIPVLAGAITALLLAAAGRLTRFDRDRSFWPTVLIVIASYYLLFAVMGGDMSALLQESAVILAFAAVALLGAFRWPVLVGVGIVAHGVFDLLHGHVITNPGVPVWWPAYCAAVDVLLGAWVIGCALRAGQRQPDSY